MGEDQEVTSEEGVRAGSIGKSLRRSSSGGALIWSGGMGAYDINDAEIRGITYEFPVAGHR